VIARIRLPESEVRDRLHSWFDEEPDVGRVLIVKLRDADTVVLHSEPPSGSEGRVGVRKSKGVTLLADTDDAAATLALFRELCGFTDDELVPLGRLRGILAGRRHRLSDRGEISP
jgi:hypothetical protein